MKRLFVFTVPGCSHCAEMKELLLKDKISFFEYTVDEHEAEFVKLLDATQNDHVPSMWIKEGDKDTYIVPERDFFTIEEGFIKIKEALNS